VAASHGVFSSEANDVLADAVFEKIVITDTLPPLQLAPEIVRSKLVILNAAALFAAAIERIHNGGSTAELLAIG
jgi:ribose-phosphate pyrophosphokinase